LWPRNPAFVFGEETGNSRHFSAIGRLLFSYQQGEVTMTVSYSCNGADAGAALASVVSDYIHKQGGVTGVVSQFEKNGLGQTAQSWVGKGENHPIFVGQLFRALGYVTLQDLGRQLGVTADEMAAKLSTVLPKAIESAVAENSRRPKSAPSLCRCLAGRRR
jgi:uncharacterized protein YidB (DUF937 family)